MEHPILLFIDDLPYHYSGNKLKTLEELLNKLKVCKDLFIVATARTDQINEEHKTWLNSQNFRIVEIPDLDETQTRLFIDSASKVFNLQIENSARSVFISKRDGTPELILIGMRNLDNEGIRHVTEKIAQGAAEESIAEAWLETRRYIEKQKPYAKYLFSALTVFYSATLTPNTYLVLCYASKLWEVNKTGKRNWRRITGLQQALKYLEQFEITNRNGIIYHADFIVENDIEADYAQNLLGAFLLKHRSIFRNNLLRRLYWQSKTQAQQLYALGIEKHLKGAYVEAEQYYKAAIKFFPHSHIYNNLFVLLLNLRRNTEAEKVIRSAIKNSPNSSQAYSNLGGLLISLNRYADAEEACKRAIKEDPYFALAHNNLGMVFEYTERLTEAEIAFRTAINIDPYFVEAHSNLGRVLFKLGHTNEAMDRMVTGLWNEPTGKGRELLSPFITPRMVKNGEEGTDSISDDKFLDFHIEIEDSDEDE